MNGELYVYCLVQQNEATQFQWIYWKFLSKFQIQIQYTTNSVEYYPYMHVIFIKKF